MRRGALILTLLAAMSGLTTGALVGLLRPADAAPTGHQRTLVRLATRPAAHGLVAAPVALRARTRLVPARAAVRPWTERRAIPAPPPPPPPEAVLDGPPLVVRLVDGETGMPLRGEVVLVTENCAEVPLVRDGTEYRARGSPSGALRFEVASVSGYMRPHKRDLVRTPAHSDFAKSVRVTIPLWRRTIVHLDVGYERGHRVPGLTALWVRVGDRFYDASRSEPRRVSVPYMPGLALTAGARTRRSYAQVTRHMARHEPDVHLTLRLPRRSDGGPGSYRGPSGNSMTGCGGPPDEVHGSASLAVSVRLRDGCPAGGVTVELFDERRWLGRDSSDAEGRLTFNNLGAGPHRIRGRATGFVDASAEIELSDGENAFVTLDEPPGGTAHIEVVTARGQPVPHARLEVTRFRNTRVELVVLHEGVQLVDHHTYVHGRCAIPHLPDCSVSVAATYGGLWVKGDWTPGETLRLVLPD